MTTRPKWNTELSGSALYFRVIAVAVLLLPVGQPGDAAILPEDRADVMYHNYDGGGLTVNGPAVLVRKGFADTVSLSATYYVDDISSATIDVEVQASPYTELRNEYGVGIDYLYEDTLLTGTYTRSVEKDYEADTYGFSVAQEMFGGMTTVSMGYARGYDDVFRAKDPTFAESIDRDTYSLGVSQILTKDFLLNAAYEFISDEGFLNSPYRGVRIGTDPRTPVNHPEVYPETRRSHAFSVSGVHYLRYGASVKAGYRYFQDTWDINANDVSFGYSQYLMSKRVIVDGRLRYYTQTGASFYSDLFATPQRYMARDKELSTFSSYSAGANVSYVFLDRELGFLDKGMVGLSLEYLYFDYEDFLDIRKADPKPYSFGALVAEAYFSLWY